jgi:hypothetical protein
MFACLGLAALTSFSPLLLWDGAAESIMVMKFHGWTLV